MVQTGDAWGCIGQAIMRIHVTARAGAWMKSAPKATFAIVLVAVILLAGSCARRLNAPEDGAALHGSTGGRLMARPDAATNADPSVEILLGPLTAGEPWPVTPDVTIDWIGYDPDGPSALPVKYKYLLVREDAPGYAAFVSDPDSLRRRAAPAFAGWDSAGGQVTRVQYLGLPHNRRYLFAIVALDDSGGVTPQVSYPNGNAFRFQTTVPDVCGAELRVESGSWSYTQGCKGSFIEHPPCDPDPITIPWGERVSFHWGAVPRDLHAVTGYRWALDPFASHGKPVGRRWNAWSLSDTSATLGPFHGEASREAHQLWIEALDDWGCMGAVMVEIRVAPRAKLAVTPG